MDGKSSRVGSARSAACALVIVAGLVAHGLGVGFIANRGEPFLPRSFDLNRLVVAAASAALIAVGIVINRPARRGPWLVLVLVPLGLAVYVEQRLWGPEPFDRWNGWFLTVTSAFETVPLVVAAWWFNRLRGVHHLTRAGLDLLTLLVAIGAYQFYLFDPTGLGLGLATDVHLIVGPILVTLWLALAARLVFVDTVPGPAVWLFGIALALPPATEIIILALPDFDDLLIPLSVLNSETLILPLLAAAAIHPSMRAFTVPSVAVRATWSWSRSVVLIVSLCLPIVSVLLSDRDHSFFDAALLVALTVAGLVAVVYRGRATVQVAADATRRLSAEAVTDPLTGLANRRGLLEALSATATPTVQLAFADVDDFKAINDVEGHARGDAVLRAIAQRLRSLADQDPSIRSVARVGGDEFAVLAVPTDGVRADVGDAILTKFKTPLTIDDIDGSKATMDVRVSVGVAALDVGTDADATHLLELLRRADLAQYEAKRSGGATSMPFQSAMGERRRREGVIRSALQDPIGSGSTWLAFQSIVDLSDESVVGVEALARMDTEAFGAISPGEFIPLAERTGDIIDFGERLVDAIVRQIDTDPVLIARRDMTVSLNLCPLQLASDRLVDVLRELARNRPDVIDRMCLEVTETVIVDDDMRRRLIRLRELGFRVALDDFGSEYASFQQLAAITVDIVKLDRQLVLQMVASDRGTVIGSQIIDLSHRLGAVVVAEGVETLEQRALLVEMGSDRGQGFLWSRPARGILPDLLRLPPG